MPAWAAIDWVMDGGCEREEAVAHLRTAAAVALQSSHPAADELVAEMAADLVRAIRHGDLERARGMRTKTLLATLTNPDPRWANWLIDAWAAIDLVVILEEEISEDRLLT